MALEDPYVVATVNTLVTKSTLFGRWPKRALATIAALGATESVSPPPPPPGATKVGSVRVDVVDGIVLAIMLSSSFLSYSL
jgi:hypothetical protein